MKIPLKNIFKMIPFLFFAKISFIIFFFVGHACAVANMDASHPWQIGFQDPATPVMEGIIFFNGFLMAFMLLIACLVGWLLYKSLILFDESVHLNPTGFTHSTLLEVVWTIIPAGILMVISIPSYNLLYAMDEVIDPSLTIKVVGHQWYWSYECSDFDVVPEVSKYDLPPLENIQKALKFWVEVSESASVETGSGAKQTQVILIKDLLNYLDNHNLDELPNKVVETISLRLRFLNILFLQNEYRKESNMTENIYPSDELVNILASVKESLEKGSLIPEQQELIFKIINHFKQYLRITENVELDVTNKDLIKSLDALLDNQGSDDGKKPGSDNDSNDDGSIISDLIDFDKSNPYWEWCELVSAEGKYDKDDINLRLAASEALVSERICTNAAVDPGSDNTPFSELIENMRQDMIKFKKAIPVAELSEDKLIDTQLIEHQLRLTRSEREGYSSKFALDSAVIASNFAKFEFNNALSELNNAKLHSHWSNIELSAANVNKLTAEYLQADASLAIADPRLIRSIWINDNGYYSWTEFLRLAIKKLSDSERLVFLQAGEKLKGANSLLGKAQRDLTFEERNRSNAIADNAKAEFMAMEGEVIPAVEEFMRGKIILANAEDELKTFQDISNRADVRLEKAHVSFNEAKNTMDRAQARLNGAEDIFNKAQVNLTGVELKTESVDIQVKLESAQKKFEVLKEEFDEAILKVCSAKSELSDAEDRLKVVNTNLEKTEKVFEDTGLLEKQIPVEGKPTEYYPNYLWEIHNEDLAFVKAQLKTDSADLEFANKSFYAAENQLSKIGGDLIESELNRGKALINLLKQDGSGVKLINNIESDVAGIELSIAKAIYIKALANFELDNSETFKLILDRAEKGLSKARLNSKTCYLGVVLENSSSDVDSDKLIRDYAESCLISTKEQLGGAEADYAKAADILNKSKVIAEKVTSDLAKDYDNPYLETLKELHKNTLLSLTSRIEQLNSTRLEFSPLDIKLNPGLLQSRSYKEVLIAKSELANIKWLSARVSKTLDIPLSNEAKPFNVQFSHLKDENYVMDSDSFTRGGNSEAGNPGDKKGGKPNIKEILSKFDDRKISYSQEGLQKEIVQTFADLLKTVDKTESNNLLKLLDESFSSMVIEEIEKIENVKEQVNVVKEILSNVDVENENNEEIQRINFDSYLIADEDLVIPEALGTGKAGKVFRLLEVDNRLFVPTNTHIRMLITSADVLHSWAVPSLGVKVDACPGRLNQVFMFVKREGVFYGQCSELCGVNHGFMPIVVQAVSQDEYLTWVGKRLCS